MPTSTSRSRTSWTRYTARQASAASGAARERVLSYIERGSAEGAQLLLDGRSAPLPARGHFLGPTVFDQVQPEMAIARDEILGPVMSIMRAPALERAVELINAGPYGTSAIIYTRSGRAARQVAPQGGW